VVISQMQVYGDSPQGEFPLSFVYETMRLGHVATPGAVAVTSGWDFANNTALS
jgi:hypothetical protein